MAVVSGINGTVTFVGMTEVANVYAWSLDVETEIVNATTYASVDDWAENVAGVRRWSGTLSWRLDDTNSATLPFTAAAALVLTAYTGRTYSGDAILSAQHITHSMEGECVVVADFVGTLAIAPL